MQSFNGELASCALCPVSASCPWLYAPRALEHAPNHFQCSTLTLTPLQMSSPSLVAAQCLFFGSKHVFIALEEMGLIFSSLKTHFSNVVFCTFSLTFKHTDFHFPFDILVRTMRFSAPLCKDRSSWSCCHWRAVQLWNTLTNYIFITKTHLTISSSKQGFEEESISHYWRWHSWNKNLLNLPLACKSCFTLLETKPWTQELKWLFFTKMVFGDYKWREMNLGEFDSDRGLTRLSLTIPTILLSHYLS